MGESHGPQLLGLRTVIYPAPDLDAARKWWTSVLDQEPYFDQPFYVGYTVGGYELGLDPDGDPKTGPITYWGVDDVDAAEEALIAAGAKPYGPAEDVGGGIRTAVVRNPQGCLVGLIYNPHFNIDAAG